MPLCARCRKPFACTCAEESSNELGAVADNCPEKKTAAVWVHVMDDRGIDVRGVGTMNDTDRERTGADGTAVFESVEPGPHTAQLEPLFPDLLVLYEKPESKPRSITVLAGQIAYVPYQLFRRPVVNVKVLQKDPRKLFDGATATMIGPEKWSADTVDGVLAEPWHVTAGPYELKVTLADEDADTYATTLDFASTPEKITLVTGEEREVVVEVEAINVVTPVVAMAEKVLVIDHWPENREALAECVELSLTQTNTAHRYAKDVTFTCASDTDVEAFLDEACSEGKQLRGTLNSGVVLPKPEQDDLRNGKTVKVYLRGKTQAGALAISLDLADPADRFVKLGEKPDPVAAEVQLLVRPHVKIAWEDGAGVDGVKVALDPDGDNHNVPDSSDGGFAKWAKRGIKPAVYNCALSFPGDVKYLLFDADGRPVDNPSFDLKPGSESVTYKIKKVKVDLALTCDGESADVEVKVKLKSLGTAVTLKKGSGAVPVEIPVTVLNQKCEIETLTLEGANVYEMVGLEPT
jgi:hypothetical protein